jgi:hypothetical protein
MSLSQAVGSQPENQIGTYEFFMKRLKEIDMFFQGTSPVHVTLKRLVDHLQQAGIPYAIMGAMAVNLHGAERTTKDVDVLMTRQGLEQFRRDFLGVAYDPVPKRPRRFVDRENGITVDVLVTGHYPGQGGSGPFPFPDPAEAGQDVKQDANQVRVVTLPQLIQLKLAARRHYDFGDVVLLIKTHQLDESFLEKLHPSVHRDFIECLEEKRRDDEYEARLEEPNE